MTTTLDAPSLTNWAGNVAFRAERVHRPTSLAELQQVVAGARSVRALGTGHSFNRIADTTADLVSVAALPRVLEVDADRRVRAGLRRRPVRRGGGAAARRRLRPAQPRLAAAHLDRRRRSPPARTGRASRNGTLASAVSALELVTADGSLRRLARGDEHFDGSVVALGALGVVHTVELDVQPTYDLRLHVYDGLSYETLTTRLEDVLSSGYSVSVFWDWRSDDALQVWRRLPADADEAPQEWLGAVAADAPRHPIPGLPGTTCTEQLGAVGPWHARLPHFRLEFTPSSGEELQSEWFVAREDAVAALTALQDVRDRIAPVLQITEIRAIAADPLWLSPSAGRDTVALHFTWVRDEAAVAPVVEAVQERLQPFAARPHWGKVFSTAPEVVRGCYDRYDDFEALVRDADPRGTFRNELLDAYFPGARA